MMDAESQNNAILAYLKRHPLGMTGLEMFQLYGALSYTRRITDLRQSGHKIDSMWEYQYDDKGKVIKKWKRYYFVG